MTTLSMTEARHNFTSIANQVIFAGERIYIKKNGKPVFAMVSIADAEALEALEDKIDMEDALKSLKEPGSIRLKDFKKKLGI